MVFYSFCTQQCQRHKIFKKKRHYTCKKKREFCWWHCACYWILSYSRWSASTLWALSETIPISLQFQEVHPGYSTFPSVFSPSASTCSSLQAYERCHITDTSLLDSISQDFALWELYDTILSFLITLSHYVNHPYKGQLQVNK